MIATSGRLANAARRSASWEDSNEITFVKGGVANDRRPQGARERRMPVVNAGASKVDSGNFLRKFLQRKRKRRG